MTGRLTQGTLGILAAAFLAAPAFTGAALQAQDTSGRYRVLVPAFFPGEDTDDDFGKDTADRFRELLARLAAYEPIAKNDIRDKLNEFDIDIEDEPDPCLTTRQLGPQLNAQVALCASYVEIGNDLVRVRVAVWDLQSGQSFELDEFEIDKDDDEEAADHIMAEFDTYTQQAQTRDLCFLYASETRYEDALRNCNQTLEVNPDDVSVLKQKANILFSQADLGDNEYDLELLEQAMPLIARVVELSPIDDTALNTAGFIATRLGRTEEGRDYYRAYLDLNPGDTNVRSTIAYQMFQAGDARGAMQFVQEGLDIESDPDLQIQFGNYAFAAAAAAAREARSEDSEGITPEVAALYRDAAEAYLAAFQVKGAEMTAQSLRNVVNAHIQLDELDRAIEIAEQVLEVHPDAAGIWRAYATALQRQDRIEDAIEAMARVEELDPEAQNLYAVQGRWLLDAGELDRAVEAFQKAVERNGQDPTAMSRNIFAEAVQAGNTDGDFAKALRYIQAAKEFDVTTEQREEFDFWHGLFLFRQGEALQEPNTLESARASLPKFQEAQKLFEASVAYGQRRPNVNHAGFMENTQLYIEVQEAIIKRGGGL